MSLEIVQQPELVALSGNPMLYKIKAVDNEGNPYGPAGFIAQVTFDGTKLAEDTLIQVTVTTPDNGFKVWVFSAKPTPSLDSEFPDDTSALSTVDYWLEVGRVIGELKDISIDWDYTVTEDSGNYTISLISRVREIGYEAEFSSAAAISTNEIEAVADNTPPNHRVGMEVRFEATWKTGGVRKIVTLESVPDELGIVNFDIGGILDPLLRIDQPLLIPQYIPSAPFRPNNVNRYTILMFEKYGSPPTRPYSLNFGFNNVMRGGISQPVASLGSIFDSFSATNSLLTWRPNKGTIDFAEPALLTWYNYTLGTATVALEVKTYNFSNALVATTYVYLTEPSVVEAYNCLTFPINPEQLGATAATSKMIVRVINATGFDPEDEPAPVPTYLSQARTYYIDHAHHEDPHYLLFPNAWGCPEVLAAHGHMTEQDEVERFVGEVLNDPEGADLREQKQYGYDWSPTYVYRTRHISLGERYALRHPWLQGELYEIFPDGYIPLRVISGDAIVTETRQELHTLEFECKPRFRMRHYSNLAIAIENMPACGDNAWLRVSDGCWRLVFGQPWELE